MKSPGKLLIALLLILLLIVLAVYILLQTSWGAVRISHWISGNSDYQFSFKKMTHHWSSPADITLDNVTLARKGQPPILVAQSVDIGLSTRQFSEPAYVSSLLLKKGQLNLSTQSGLFPLRADRLLLNDMQINSVDSSWQLRAQQVNGGVTPWLPQRDSLLGKKSDIQFSAGSLVLNGIPASNILIQGTVDNNQITFTNMGADLARGSLTGSAQRNRDGSWQINRLQLSDIRLQTEKTITQMLAPITQVPSVKIDNLDITNARLEGKNWAVTDLNLSLRNFTVTGNSWKSDDGKLSMNASEFVNGTLQLSDPIVNADFNSQGMMLRQFSSRWERGLLRTSGQWLRNDKRLALDEVVIAGIEYTLPADWKTRWLKTLPEWLSSLTVKKLSMSRNLIIDISPRFPFQITALDGYANKLTLVNNRQWGIWAGNLNFYASAATFNRTDVRRPSIALTASPEKIDITELNAFAGQGLLDATASITQTPQRAVTLNLTGNTVPINILQQWGWPALPLEGEGNIRLSATGLLAPGTTLKPTVNATLQATSADGKQLQQQMQKGTVPGA